MTGEMTLNSPLAEEQWGAITDVDFDHTSNYGLKLNTGKRVEFVKRKTGKWIKEDRGRVEPDVVCSECGFDWMWSDRGYFKYCPNCGARMEES